MPLKLSLVDRRRPTGTRLGSRSLGGGVHEIVLNCNVKTLQLRTHPRFPPVLKPVAVHSRTDARTVLHTSVQNGRLISGQHTDRRPHQELLYLAIAEPRALKSTGLTSFHRVVSSAAFPSGRNQGTMTATAASSVPARPHDGTVHLPTNPHHRHHHHYAFPYNSAVLPRAPTTALAITRQPCHQSKTNTREDHAPLCGGERLPV